MSKFNQNSTGLLLVLLLVSGQVIQSQATAFIIGGACVLALNTAEQLIGGQIIARGLTQAVEDVQALCRFIQRYSVGGVIYYQILPRLTRLVGLAGRQLTQGNAIDEFETVVRELADLSAEVTAQG